MHLVGANANFVPTIVWQCCQQKYSALVTVRMEVREKWRPMGPVIVAVFAQMAVLMSLIPMENVHVNVPVKTVNLQLWAHLAANAPEMCALSAKRALWVNGLVVNANVQNRSVVHLRSVLMVQEDSIATTRLDNVLSALEMESV